MNKKQDGLLIVFALAAGVIGGVVANQFFASTPAFATQQKQNQAETILAKRLVLVDDSGQYRAMLFLNANNQPTLILTDADERPRFALTLKGSGEPSLNLIGKGGQSQAMLSNNTLVFKDKSNVPRPVPTVTSGETSVEVLYLGSMQELFEINPGKIIGMITDLKGNKEKEQRAN
jgi:hypothetical protein